MTERPILFSAPMVRAILDGRKTQTRRPVKPPLGDAQRIEECAGGGWMVDRKQINFPFAPGMRLWVRETWLQWECPDHGQEPCQCTGYPAIRYRADGEIPAVRWRSGIHMSRWASRILLEITAVRVERLQEISIQDAMAEGVAETAPRLKDLEPCMEWCYAYEDLWNAINGPGAWDANPWVWVVQFRRVEA